jgi:DNA modification methylase
LNAPSAKHRRSLTHVGGETETAGNHEVATALAFALDVEPSPSVVARARSGEPAKVDDDPDRAHVHGFHSYPARMHPTTAARLVAAISNAGSTVLDPFCGSGTVLVEAMLAGRCALGTDLNPIAVLLAQLKTTPCDASARESLVAGARTVGALANSRRERKAGATRRYSPEDVALFDPHVLLELDSLRAGIGSHPGIGGAAPKHALELVLSSILLKVSRRMSDTSTATTPRRIAAGYPTNLFVRKAEELARRMGDFAALLAAQSRKNRPAIAALDDAGRLRTLGASTVDAIVTSPPYVANYDYLEHHSLRTRWLALDTRDLVAREIGARRRYAKMDAGAAEVAWKRELSAALRAMSRVCRPGARVALLVADSAVGGQALRADAILSSIAPELGFAVLARASQRRPVFHGPSARAFERAPRSEHAIALVKRA